METGLDKLEINDGIPVDLLKLQREESRRKNAEYKAKKRKLSRHERKTLKSKRTKVKR